MERDFSFSNVFHKKGMLDDEDIDEEMEKLIRNIRKEEEKDKKIDEGLEKKKKRK